MGVLVQGTGRLPAWGCFSLVLRYTVESRNSGRTRGFGKESEFSLSMLRGESLLEYPVEDIYVEVVQQADVRKRDCLTPMPFPVVLVNLSILCENFIL